MRNIVIVLATGAALAACAPTGRSGMPDHMTAPGHASGQAPAHVMNSMGGGSPEVHRPEPTFGQPRQNLGGPTPTITGGGQAGGQEVQHPR